MFDAFLHFLPNSRHAEKVSRPSFLERPNESALKRVRLSEIDGDAKEEWREQVDHLCRYVTQWQIGHKSVLKWLQFGQIAADYARQVAYAVVAYHGRFWCSRCPTLITFKKKRK